MLKKGLCSVTFRDLTAEQIIELAVKADLEGIEWGGDIHVPPGDYNRAAEISQMTIQAGLEIISYGSYYRVGCENENRVSFEEILQTAVELKAPEIRVWAGNRGSEDANETYWEAVISDSRKVASLAEMNGVKVNYEYHGGTLTDTKESAHRLMNEVDHHNTGLYWQPAVGLDVESRIESIKTLNRWLTHLHVFYWIGKERFPLNEGEQEWLRYLHTLEVIADNRYVMLEFVKENDQEQFLQDAKTLNHFLKM